ncbi:uncharacterized protein LOC143033017 [Oratosquilla oratoria]|uniref:uncharacterized protein LOC143033017 n=1 Tax=Oratosquilla oratoria TaxID=337810 RepID=UPI003F76CA78
MIDNNKSVNMEDLIQIPEPRGRDKVTTDSNNNRNQPTSRIAEKYGLRPRTIIKRIQMERSKQELSFKGPKPKAKPPPLSKYRRKTANARERHRMKEINDAFETLRKALPSGASARASASMTKITTLKLAVNYIKALGDILDDGHASDICSFQTIYPAGEERAIMCMEQISSCCSTNPSTTTTTTEVCILPGRGSVSSASDIADLLSDSSSSVLEDHLAAFDDIPALSADPFDILLESDGDSIAFGS